MQVERISITPPMRGSNIFGFAIHYTNGRTAETWQRLEWVAPNWQNWAEQRGVNFNNLPPVIYRNFNQERQTMTTTPPTCTSECTAEQLRAFTILNEIREMGIVNMFGAVAPLMEISGYSRPEATTYLREWMQWGHELTTS